MIREALLILSLICVSIAGSANAHEIRPAYLELTETGPAKFAALWKVPARSESRLSLYVVLPKNCITLDKPVSALENSAFYERWIASCPGGLDGREIRVEGLQSTLTDVLARVAFADGTVRVARLTPENPAFIVEGSQSMASVAATYFRLGVDHILRGVDHLLFVAALMLLIRAPWALLKTITAFTVAHSITLSGAALGYFSLPQKPVEAIIALSITFVARELIMVHRGIHRSSEDYPWIVAFTFGLLHGFGFAGALKEIGLPQTDVPVALLTFNLGVEAGQILFIAAVLAAVMFLNRISAPMGHAKFAASYVIGAVSTSWLVIRLADLLS